MLQLHIGTNSLNLLGWTCLGGHRFQWLIRLLKLIVINFCSKFRKTHSKTLKKTRASQTHSVPLSSFFVFPACSLLTKLTRSWLSCAARRRQTWGLASESTLPVWSVWLHKAQVTSKLQTFKPLLYINLWFCCKWQPLDSGHFEKTVREEGQRGHSLASLAKHSSVLLLHQMGSEEANCFCCHSQPETLQRKIGAWPSKLTR